MGRAVTTPAFLVYAKNNGKNEFSIIEDF